MNSILFFSQSCLFFWPKFLLEFRYRLQNYDHEKVIDINKVIINSQTLTQILKLILLAYMLKVCCMQCLLCIAFNMKEWGVCLLSKIQQTKMLVTCQRFGDLILFGLIWQYSSNHKTYNKGRFKVIATYLQQ